MGVSCKISGQVGEDMAVEYLIKHGYHIYYRNYRSRYGEIDVIAEENGDLVFIEVKARSSGSFGAALESVNYKKQDKLRHLALLFIANEGKVNENYRFDVVAVTVNDSKVKIELLKNAF